VDAMFQPRPHGAIAVDPLPTSPYDFPGDVNRLLWAATDDPRSRAWGKQHIGWCPGLESQATTKDRPRGKPLASATNRSPRATMSSTDANAQELSRVPNFFNCRRSLAASASNQSRNVTILGSVVVAFGQMIQ
jgi:hypothetical protein